MSAVELACRLIEESATAGERFVKCSDSLSMVITNQNYSISDHMVQRLQRRTHQLQEAGQDVVIIWQPGHSGIQGNVLVDAVVMWPPGHSGIQGNVLVNAVAKW